MRTALMTTAGVVAAATLISVSVAGCHHDSHSAGTSEPVATTTASHRAGPGSGSSDYAALLIRAEDIDAPEAFTATAPTLNPDGKEGVTTTFSNDDRSHVIVDTILILPDPAAAAAALEAERTTVPGSGTGKPKAVKVGTSGTSVSADSPDGSKGVTVLRFTEGRAFVTIQFDGPPGMSAPPDFVTDVGQKQDDAIKNGLPS